MHTFARSLRFLSNYFVEISLLMCSFFISRIKIASRPIRTWFQSSSAKEAAAAASKKQADEGGVWGALEGQKVQKRHKKQQVSRGATPEERLKAIRKSERNGAGAGGGAVETTIHRLSRKKRRRLEVMAGMDQMEHDDREASEKEAGWRRSWRRLSSTGQA